MRDKEEKGYHKLLIWQRLKEFIKFVYLLVEELPEGEKFGLMTQMKRAVVPVASNFVEGYMRRSKKDKVRFLEISEGLLLELEAQGEICRILEYWDEEEYQKFDQKRGEIAYLIGRYKAKINF